QDVLQEAWLRGLQGIERYDPACSFRGWMLAIIKNLLLQAYRRRSYDLQRGSRPPVHGDFDVLDCPDSVTSISVRLAKEESLQRFLAYVSGLPFDDRMLVLYCGF